MREPQAFGTAPTRPLAGYRGRFSVSDTGMLVLQDGVEYDYQLVWFDRAGRKIATLGAADRVSAPYNPRISPEGKRVVIQRTDPKTRNQDLWVVDLARDAFNRLTTIPVQHQMPVWSPDGNRVFFSSGGGGGVHAIAASGGDETVLIKGTRYPKAVSPDGKVLIFTERGEKTRLDIWAFPLSGGAEPHVLVNSEFDDGEPDISPNGRWLAYVSDVTGGLEVYVQALTPNGRTVGEKVRVSNGGGLEPRWRGDGQELFYVGGTEARSTSS